MPKSARFERLVPLLLAAAVLLTFLWTFNAPAFIAHEESILRLPLLSWWKNVPLIFSRYFLMFTDGQFRPLSYALLAVVRTFVSADSVGFWRLWLWLFHWVNALLVYFLVRRFSKRAESAFVAALAFAWHPLASLVANQVNNFHYALGLTFYLGSLYSYVRFSDTKRGGSYATAVALFGLGLLTSKIAVSLPFVILAYELLYQRTRLPALLLRLVGFAALLLFCLPFWLFYKPHPLHYKYVDFPPGTGWNSLFTVVGASGWYLKGLLGLGLPVVLEEAVDKIMRVGNWRFFLWGLIVLLALLVAAWALFRKRWSALGVILLIVSVLPFASTAWNGVHDYVSWVYLYVSLAGLAVLAGGLADGLWPSGRTWRGPRGVGVAALCLVVVYFGAQQLRLNLISRSAGLYWLRVVRLNPQSERASLSLGKVYLDRDEPDKALGFLFSPVVRDVGASSLAANTYYCTRGDHLAAAVHFRVVGDREEGLLFQQTKLPGAALFAAAGAPDYAEAALGSALMANPFNVEAMDELAQVWLLKGYVTAAEGLLGRMLSLAPRNQRTLSLKAKLEAHRRAPVTSDTSAVIRPPLPGWLRYVTQNVQDARIGPAVVQLAEQHPGDPIIQMTAATYLMQHGQLQLAKEKLDTVTQSLVSFGPAWARKCWVDVKLGDFASAEAAGRRALEFSPTSSAVHNVLATLWSSGPPHRRSFARAERHYLQTLATSPNQASAHVGLGNALMAQGRFDEAMDHYQQALAINGSLVEAQGNLGLAYLRQGKLDEAVAHLRRALEMAPDSPAAHFNLGFALMQQGKVDEAIICLRAALNLNPQYVEAHNELGTALVRQGKLQQAAQCFGTSLSINPDDATAHNNLGMILSQSGRLDEAVAHYQAALEARPAFREAYNNLGMALMGQGRYDAAIQTVRRWLALMPRDVSEGIRLAWLLATCPDDASRSGLEAISLAQNICNATEYKNSRALDALAAAHAEMGRFDTAVELASRARQIALSEGQQAIADQIEVRIQMYRDGQPYRLGR